MENTKKELRFNEIRAVNNESEEMVLEGYAVVFERITDIGWFKEIIDRNAFRTTDMKDTALKYNHSNTVSILARTRNKSLELTIDDKGLKIRAKLIDTTSNRDFYKMVKEGLLDKMSFSFHASKEEWDYDNDTRRVLEIDKLWDVSIVDVPAYEDTEISARKKEEYSTEKEKYNNSKNQLKRNKLALELELLDM